MRSSIRPDKVWRHGAQSMVRARGRAEEEQQPGALQVREQGELREERGFLGEAAFPPRPRELRAADRDPQGEEPPLGQWLVAAPDLRA